MCFAAADRAERIDMTDLVDISLIDPAGIDVAFRNEWQELAKLSARPNPFFEDWFLLPSLEQFDQKQNVKILVARSVKEGALVGLLPVQRKLGYRKTPIVYYQAFIHSFCFNGTPLIRKSWSQPFFNSLADWIETKPDGARFLQLLALPYGPDMVEIIEASFGKDQIFIQNLYNRAYLNQFSNNKNTYKEYIDKTLSPKRRGALRRARRHLEKMGTLTIGDVPVNEEVIEDYFALEKTSWKSPEKSGLSPTLIEAQKKLFKEVISTGAEQGCVECRGLYLNQRLIALAFQLRRNKYLAGFKTVYDTQYARYSPGVHVLLDVIKAMLEGDDLQEFDSCSQADHPLLDRIMVDRMPMAQINLIGSSRLSRLIMGALSKTSS